MTRFASNRWTHLVLLLGLLTGWGCSCGDDEPADLPDGGGDGGVDAGDAGPEGVTVWQAYEAAQEAVRQSPDHLPARADALIAAGDPEAIFEFVRDAIVLYPDTEDGFSLNSANTKLWGARGALRSGTGSPRDKAELLALLLGRAGFEAEVVYGTALPERIDMKDALSNQERPAFSPGDIELDWQSAFVGETSAPPQSVDPNGEARKALAAKLGAVATSRMEPRAFNFELTRVPLVGITIDGEQTLANPIYADAEYGQSYVEDDRVFPRGVDPSAPGTITVRLWAEAGDDELTLVEHEYALEDVLGRRIVVQSPPEGALRDTFLERQSSFQRFVPALSVEGPDLDQAAREALFVAGPTLTTLGEQFSVGEEGQVVGPRGAIGGERNAALEASVATLEVEAQAHAFPSVSLNVFARDDAGDLVEGLVGSAFDVFEDEQRMRAQLLRNVVPPERVLLVFDDSGSLPPEFLEEGRTEFAEMLVRDVLAKRPEAQVRIASVGASNLIFRSDWSSDVPTLDASVAYEPEAFPSSNLWHALDAAAHSEATLTVLVSDGEAIDEPTPAMQARIAGAAPVVFLQAGAPEEDDAPELVRVSNGQLFSVSMHDEAIAAVVDYLDAFAPAPYVLRYAAPRAGAQTREVTVGIVDQAPETQTNYDAPAQAAPSMVFDRLFLTVSRSLTESATQQLAGAAPRREPTSEDYEDVFAALFGSTAIAIEGGPVTSAQLVDDWFAHKLSTRPFAEATADPSLENVVAAAEEGALRWPATASVLSSELAGQFADDSLTFEPVTRVVLNSIVPQADGTFESRVDIMPLTRLATAASVEDGRTDPTLETSLELALLEAARYEQSAVDLLAQSEFVATDSIAVGGYLDSIDASDEQKDRWRSLIQSHSGLRDFVLVPTTGEPLAFFAIDERTGRALAVLPNGTGGGLSPSGAPDGFYDSFAAAATFGGATGLGFWIALQKAIARQLIIATAAIRNLEGVDPGVSEDVGAAASDAYCDFIKGILGSVTGSLGTALSEADAVLTLLGFGIPCG